MSVYSDLILSQGPSLYWPLDGGSGATDQSGNGRNGTGAGGITIGGYSGSPIARETSATDFTGDDDRITSTYNPFSNAAARSFSGWAYRDGSGADHTLIAGNNGGLGGAILFLESGGQNVTWRTQVLDTGAASAKTWATAWPGNTQWVHWALVYDPGADTAALYINGALVSTATGLTQTFTASTPLAVGAIDGIVPFDGKMAHVAVFPRALSAQEIALQRAIALNPEFLVAAGQSRPRRSRLHVVVTTPTGAGYDLTSEVNGLQYSNVRPGGDEQASFELRRSWLLANPEVTRGSDVEITDGITRVWAGRIEEINRSSDETEMIEVTCYGRGARLRDKLRRMIFADTSKNAWVGPSSSERLIQMASGAKLHDHQVVPDTTNGLPTMQLGWESTEEGYYPRCLAGYDAGADCTVAMIYLASSPIGAAFVGGPTLLVGVEESDAWSAGAGEYSSDKLNSSGYYTPVVARRYAALIFAWANTVGWDGFAAVYASLPQLVVYGPHGITPQGDAPGGFTSNQIVTWVLSQVAGVDARLMDAMAFIIKHFVIDTPTADEDIIAGANEYEGAAWGTWPSDAVLDRSDTGYFDYTKPSTNGDWVIRREDCDDVDLTDELGSLFDRVLVHWRDTAGEEHTEIVTKTVPALAEAGIPSDLEIDAGTTTQAGAQRLADVAFQLQGTDPPSRGSIEITQAVKHRERGLIDPIHMRADGSNVKIPNALTKGEAFSLERVDRRTVFPIQRVSVDASGAIPRVNVDLDQTADQLSVLQAQLATEVSPGGGGGGADGGGGSGSGAASPASGRSRLSAKLRMRKPKRGRRMRAKQHLGS